jgi:BirA family biotin operon repressor/biotin-[acetyl-CoA-carboxylase] ligase
MKIIELDMVDSTNEYCKREDRGEDFTVVAFSQNAGKGTKGRSFVSSSDGLYLSRMCHYQNFDSANTFKIMVNACVGVCKTLENFKIHPTIRWANDVLVNGKKISGTLIENSFSGSSIRRSIVGIGLNVNNTLPDDLLQIATTMKEALCSNLDIKKVEQTLLKNLEREYDIKDYKRYINWLGEVVIIKTESEELKVKAIDISERGELVVMHNGEIKKINSAEVTLRLL